ncbi:MAG: hypothetical protein LH606_17185 [Cytophagaceae bacterium]|nr:hypothetical protein [Cytophagaceae bacterium]
MRKILTILLILGVVAFGIILLLSSLSYSEGDRAGTVSKFSQKGYVFKTWEGELLQGGFSEGTGQLNAKEFLFTVSSGRDSVTTKLKEAMLNGKRVRLHYQEKYFRFFWMGDSKYYITEVDFAQQ